MLKTIPKIGETVWIIDSIFPAHATSPIYNIKPRIVREIRDNGLWIGWDLKFESFEFLYLTKEDAEKEIDNLKFQ